MQNYKIIEEGSLEYQLLECCRFSSNTERKAMKNWRKAPKHDKNKGGFG